MKIFACGENPPKLFTIPLFIIHFLSPHFFHRKDLPMFIWLAIIAVTVFLDQITKYLTILYLKPLATFPLIEDVLHLTYVENTGAAFGMMKDARWVFMLTSTVAIVGILVYMFVKRPTDKLLCTSLSFIVGGGIGNMIDRTILGYVVDMIDLRLIQFAVFNVADSFVCVGAGMMILYLILDMIREAKAEKAAAEADAAADAIVDTAAEAESETASQEDAAPGEEADHA
jgi:signal peptidase II